jgi:hypothetical protein
MAAEIRAKSRTQALEISDLARTQWAVMTRLIILIFAALIALSQSATAGVPLFGHVSCTVVRFYVARYSEPAAEKWARSHGASDAEIETARHCLHSGDVQTASRASRPQVVAAVSEHEGAQHEPDEDALHLSVEGQRANPEQNSHDDQSIVHHALRPKEIEDHSAGMSKIKDDLVPTDAKTGTLRPRNVDTMHRAYRPGATRHVAWFKRLWDHLTRQSQFTVAFLHLNGSRR